MELITIGSIGWHGITIEKELYDAVMLFLQKNTVNIKTYGDVTQHHTTSASDAELAQGIDIE